MFIPVVQFILKVTHPRFVFLRIPARGFMTCAACSIPIVQDLLRFPPPARLFFAIQFIAERPPVRRFYPQIQVCSFCPEIRLTEYRSAAERCRSFTVAGRRPEHLFVSAVRNRSELA